MKASPEDVELQFNPAQEFCLPCDSPVEPRPRSGAVSRSLPTEHRELDTSSKQFIPPPFSHDGAASYVSNFGAAAAAPTIPPHYPPFIPSGTMYTFQVAPISFTSYPLEAILFLVLHRTWVLDELKVTLVSMYLVTCSFEETACHPSQHFPRPWATERLTRTLTHNNPLLQDMQTYFGIDPDLQELGKSHHFSRREACFIVVGTSEAKSI
jgi:hypothetical protein